MESVVETGIWGRQLGVFNPNNPEHQRQIIGVGAGTIGSWVIFGLAKLGCQKITWIDYDSVELHNCPNQLFPPSMVGKGKLASMQAILKSFSLCNQFPMVAIPEKLPDNIHRILIEPTIFVSCVDNMKTRKEMFELAKAHPLITHFVDGRMAGQVIMTYTVNMSDIGAVEKYEATLYSDDSSGIVNEEVRQASDVPCTERSIVDVAMIISGKMVGAIRKICTGGYNVSNFVFDAKNDILLS